MNKQFGSGFLYADPDQGNQATNPTPERFGILQEAQFDHKGSNEKLFGQGKYAVDISHGPVDVTVKSKLALLSFDMWNQLALGQTRSTGAVRMAIAEAHTAIAPAQPAAHATGHAQVVGDLCWDGTNVQKCVTAGNTGAVAPAAWGTVLGAETADGAVVWQCMGPNYGNVAVVNAAQFSRDYGVHYANGGTQLTKVSGVPAAAGQYACDGAGNYTSAAADAGLGMLIDYAYTTASGLTIEIAQKPLGYGPKFRAFIYNEYDNDFVGIELYRCVVSDISLPTKQKGYWICDLNFEACCNASDKVLRFLASA